MIASPLEALARYQDNAPTLTYLLFAFSVPILSLILAFIGLVAGLFVNQQRGEMAILRSRGASTLQVVGISLLQGILLGAVALAGGVGLGYWITHSIGKARSFLDFSAAGGLRVSMTPQVLGYGLLGIAIILIIQVLIPTLERGGKYDRYLQAGTRPLLPRPVVAALLAGCAFCSSLQPMDYGNSLQQSQTSIGGIGSDS